MHVSGAEAEGSLLRSLHLLSSQRYLRNLLDEVSRRPLQYSEAEPAGSSNAAAMLSYAAAMLSYAAVMLSDAQQCSIIQRHLHDKALIPKKFEMT